MFNEFMYYMMHSRFMITIWTRVISYVTLLLKFDMAWKLQSVLSWVIYMSFYERNIATLDNAWNWKSSEG